MWWPSFVSVLHDLWLFCTGRSQSTQVSAVAPDQLGAGRVTAAPAAVVRKNVVLIAGGLYDAGHPDTVQIRSRLSAYDTNIISAGPLTEYEWLLYNVQGKRVSVPLLALRLTPLGRWHTTLKGQSDISIGVTPYTNSLVEWKDGDQDRVGWVQEVSPDETFVIGQLGKNQPGLYETQSYTRAQWLELRPVFTSFA